MNPDLLSWSCFSFATVRVAQGIEQLSNAEVGRGFESHHGHTYTRGLAALARPLLFV